MDLLSRAYSNGSDDDEPDSEIPWAPPPSKRPKPDYSLSKPAPVNNVGYCPILRNPNPQTEAPTPGRYISKRERALMGSSSDTTNLNSPPMATPSVIGNISRANLRHDILLSLRHQPDVRADKINFPSRKSINLNSHQKPVNTIQWSKTHAHLLASAGMDNAIYIWNVWSEQNKKAREFTYHHAAVKDVKWSAQGQFILSCGYDCSSRLVDIEKGSETQVFLEDQAVTAIEFHPHNSNLFLSGGSKGLLKLWDIRIGKVVHEYLRRLGPILDVEFMVDGKQFISSSDVSQSNLSENSLIVWDVAREVPLSNQLYVEAYTCPCVRRHPFDPFFVAQSNGNYLAIFSTKHPFKLDKYKRFESHGVYGFPIKCDYSFGGEILASGSSDGNIYFYSVKSSKVLKKIKVYDEPCVDIAFHPLISNVIASCSWIGHVTVLE